MGNSRNDFGLSRRELVVGAMSLPAGLATVEGMAREGLPVEEDGRGSLTIYSPAPPANPMHALNLMLQDAAKYHPALSPLHVPPLALPDSINSVSGLPVEQRRNFWPIVTTVDFEPARRGAGPDWHGYPRACPDLKYVSALYDVGFGIALWGKAATGPDCLRGKRIAVPARPSAVRLMTEVLLRDGWGLSDEVMLVDMVPSQVAAAHAAGEIDGTSWNLAVPGDAGHRPILPAGPGVPLRYVAVDEDVLARINAASPFTLALSPLLDGAPPLLSFAQALAAWDESDPAQITAMLHYIEGKAERFPGYPNTVQAMISWPGLTAQAVHPAALAFYASRGVML